MNKHAFLMLLAVAVSNCFAEEKLLWTFNAETKMMVAYHRTSHMVAVLDFPHNKTCLYNGTSGAAFITDYEKGEAVYLTGLTSNETWYSSRQTFDDYFANLPSQETIYKVGETKGVKFNQSSITAELSETMAKMLTPLSSEYSDPSVAFSTIVAVCRINSRNLKSSLNSLSNVTGNVRSEIRGDVKWLVQVFMGYGEFFGEFKSGVNLLVDEGIKLDFNTVLKEPTGIDVLNYFLKQMAPKLDIGDILGHALNSEQRFFQLVNGLGAQMSYGFDGFINIISKIEDFVHDDGSMQEMRTLLHAYSNHPKTDADYVKREWPRAIGDLSDTIKKFNLTESLKGLAKLLQDILGNRWAVNGVNMTEILQGVLKIEANNDISAVTNVLGLLQKSLSSSVNNLLPFPRI